MLTPAFNKNANWIQINKILRIYAFVHHFESLNNEYIMHYDLVHHTTESTDRKVRMSIRYI